MTMVIYSSWETFTRVLNDPTMYGFKAEDTKKMGGSIWVDHIHPTSRVHAFIAEDLDEFLKKYADTGKPDKA